MAKNKRKKKVSNKSVLIAVASIAVVGMFVPSDDNSAVTNNTPQTEIHSQIEEDSGPQSSAEEDKSETAPIPQQEKEADTSSPSSSDSESSAEPQPEPEPEPEPEVDPEPEPDTQPEPDPEPEPEPEVDPEQAFREKLMQYNYVASSESDKYHYPTCTWTKKINDENLVHFDTEDEATAAGYSPCGTCKP